MEPSVTAPRSSSGASPTEPGTTPQHSGGDAHSAANTQPKAKKRKPDGGSSTESARESTKSPRPIHGSISESFRPGDLQNGGPHARHALQPTTMGAARDAEQEQRVLGPNSVNMLPSLEQEICMRALTEVIRSRSLNAKDKVKQLGVMCLRPEGSLLRSCLDGNGWSSKRNRTEGYPSWPEAVHRLTLALHALANNEPVQVAEQTPGMVYVTADGDNSYVTCSCLESSAVWLRTVMSPRCVNLKKLDLSGAKGHIKLAGNSVGALLQPLHDGARVRELILSNSPLQDNGALAIAAYLKSARCALEILDVSECFLWTAGCIAILEASLQARTLQRLSLSKNDVGAGDLVVADLLRRDWQLLSLDLSHCHCSQQGMEAIAEALLINRRLSHLSLEGNKGGYENGVDRWCSVIADTDYLHTLRLPEPVRREDMERLQISGAQREKLVLQPIEWQMAVAMALHPRLGANSPLHCLEALMIKDIAVDRTMTQFQLQLVTEEGEQ